MKRRSPRRLAVLQLEGRDNPSGNVLASVNSFGDLILVGDGANDGGAGNQVDIEETGPKQYSIQPFGGTTVNGSSSAVPVNGVHRDLKVNFFGGDDLLYVNNFVSNQQTVLRDITVNMGRGTDTLIIDNVFARNVTVNSPAGNSGDDIVILNTTGVGYSGAITGDVAINNKVGATQTIVQATISGNLAISNSGGGDTVVIMQGSLVAGSIAVTEGLGAGNNSLFVFGSALGDMSITALADSDITVESASVGGDLRIKSNGVAGASVATTVGNSAITGSMTINAGPADDSIDIFNSHVGKEMTIHAGKGKDTIRIRSGVSVAEHTAIYGGDNDDSVAITDYPNNFGSLSIAAGNGDNTIELGAAAVIGDLNVTAGNGTDTLKTGGAGGHNLSTGGITSFNLGNGGNSFFVTGTDPGLTLNLHDLIITGGTGTDLVDIRNALIDKVTLSFGTGADIVYVNQVFFLDDFSARLGGGADTMEVGTFNIGITGTEFFGDLSIDAGADADTIQISGADPVQNLVRALRDVSIKHAETLTIDTNNAQHTGYPNFI